MTAEPLPNENVKPIAIRAPRAPATRNAAPSPLDIVQAALASGNVEMYREAVALMKDMDTFAARKAFDAAMADAKAEIPTIKRNRLVDAGLNSSGKQGPKYRFEDLAEIAQTVDPILSKHGLSYRYRVASPVNQPVTVTCIVSHRDGHFEETTLTAGRDDGPGRNAIQQVASTITYLQRYTLKAALGLAVSHDDDGASSEAEPAQYQPPAGSISPAQAEELRLMLTDKGASERAFLAWASNPQRAYLAAGETRMEAIKAEAFLACKAGISGFRKG